MDSWRMKTLALAAAAGLAFLASCDNGPSAVETRARSAEAPAWSEQDEPRDHADSRRPERSEPRAERRAANDEAPDFDGKPLWSSNRKYSAVQNAAYHYRRNGKDFGARSQKDYVAKAHAFIQDPPRGVLTLTRRNGDRLLYHPASNTFAVATRAGAPRTMFKPEDGMAYWERQQARERNGGSQRAQRADSEDNG
ncbi:MAG TPA: hypothetical protein VEA15_01660 [Caulobacteraceae bacterium]|nr:hypothetical protein [Caulobacteraceae bacterium]